MKASDVDLPFASGVHAENAVLKISLHLIGGEIGCLLLAYLKRTRVGLVFDAANLRSRHIPPFRQRFAIGVVIEDEIVSHSIHLKRTAVHATSQRKCSVELADWDLTFPNSTGAGIHVGKEEVAAA